jgi:Leucine-rich repeat (LRR) protein
MYLDANSLSVIPAELTALVHLEQITLNMNKLIGFLPLCSILSLRYVIYLGEFAS